MTVIIILFLKSKSTWLEVNTIWYTYLKI